jgi:hypothetical protein
LTVIAETVQLTAAGFQIGKPGGLCSSISYTSKIHCVCCAKRIGFWLLAERSG